MVLLLLSSVRYVAHTQYNFTKDTKWIIKQIWSTHHLQGFGRAYSQAPRPSTGVSFPNTTPPILSRPSSLPWSQASKSQATSVPSLHLALLHISCVSRHCEQEEHCTRSRLSRVPGSLCPCVLHPIIQSANPCWKPLLYQALCHVLGLQWCLRPYINLQGVYTNQATYSTSAFSSEKHG